MNRRQNGPENLGNSTNVQFTDESASAGSLPTNEVPWYLRDKEPHEYETAEIYNCGYFKTEVGGVKLRTNESLSTLERPDGSRVCLAGLIVLAGSAKVESQSGNGEGSVLGIVYEYNSDGQIVRAVVEDLPVGGKATSLSGKPRIISELSAYTVNLSEGDREFIGREQIDPENLMISMEQMLIMVRPGADGYPSLSKGLAIHCLSANNQAFLGSGAPEKIDALYGRGGSNGLGKVLENPSGVYQASELIKLLLDKPDLFDPQNAEATPKR